MHRFLDDDESINATLNPKHTHPFLYTVPWTFSAQLFTPAYPNTLQIWPIVNPAGEPCTGVPSLSFTVVHLHYMHNLVGRPTPGRSHLGAEASCRIRSSGWAAECPWSEVLHRSGDLQLLGLRR